MKFYSILFLFLSLPVKASLNEVECFGKTDSKEFQVGVERDFSGWPILRPALLTVREDDMIKTYEYSVTTRMPGGFNRITYSAYGLRLEVDLAGHQTPHYGWTYKGTLASKILENEYIQGLKCLFPNAH